MGPTQAGLLLADLAARGLVQCWRPPSNPQLDLWTLTPLAAALLEVQLVESGPDELWKWDTHARSSHQPRDPALTGSPPRPDFVSVLGLEAPVVVPPTVKRKRGRAHAAPPLPMAVAS